MAEYKAQSFHWLDLTASSEYFVVWYNFPNSQFYLQEGMLSVHSHHFYPSISMCFFAGGRLVGTAIAFRLPAGKKETTEAPQLLAQQTMYSSVLGPVHPILPLKLTQLPCLAN